MVKGNDEPNFVDLTYEPLSALYFGCFLSEKEDDDNDEVGIFQLFESGSSSKSFIPDSIWLFLLFVLDLIETSLDGKDTIILLLSISEIFTCKTDPVWKVNLSIGVNDLLGSFALYVSFPDLI